MSRHTSNPVPKKAQTFWASAATVGVAMLIKSCVFTRPEPTDWFQRNAPFAVS
jgi:hypothetical protein